MAVSVVCAVVAGVLWAPGPAAAQAPAAVDEARLPAPAYPDVIALAAGGQSSDALVRLDEELHAQGVTSLPLPARLLRAHLLAQAGRPDESGALWQSIAAVPDTSAPLRDLALRSALSVLLQGNRLTAASAALDALTAAHDGHADPQALVDLAQAYVKAGDEGHAGPLFERALQIQQSGTAADAAYLGLAAVKDHTGDAAGALALLREAELHFDQPVTFTAARATERQIATRVKQPVAPFTEDQYAALAGQLSGDVRYQAAIDLLDEWAARYPGTDRADEIDSLRAGVLFAQRADDKAMAAATRFLRDHPHSRFEPDVRTVQFRLDVREQRTASVVTRGRALWLGRVPGVKREDRFSLGRLLAAYLVGVGQVKQGLSMYRRLYGEAVSRDDRADILWRAGVAAVRVGEYSRAVANLTSAIRLQPGPQIERVCRYWLGVAQLRLGRRRDAIATLTALVHDDLYQYYGVEALHLLRQLATGHPDITADLQSAMAPAQAFPDLTLEAASRNDALLAGADLLAQAGLRDDAADFARRAALAHRSDRALGLLAARALDAIGRHRDAVALLGARFAPYLDAPSTGLPADFWTLVYPRAYWPAVKAAAADNRVDPLLLLSIMRRESLFDASAVSRSGAVGLFQVMSYTAADYGSAKGGDPGGRADLTAPTVSAEIGARLVARLMHQFAGAMSPVIASYNAGEDLVSVWWKTVPGRSEPLFVDTMPYGETRNYVRAVLTNYFAYQRLYGQGDH
ncbi:MAG TPA: transglycosylase SLT domain-containing protein [Vicinamibacterales bacterium]|nr:transglycosylase SLT domain-containing protein [Vicinamibacterales bacterium]